MIFLTHSQSWWGTPTAKVKRPSTSSLCVKGRNWHYFNLLKNYYKCSRGSTYQHNFNWTCECSCFLIMLQLLLFTILMNLIPIKSFKVSKSRNANLASSYHQRTDKFTYIFGTKKVPICTASCKTLLEETQEQKAIIFGINLVIPCQMECLQCLLPFQTSLQVLSPNLSPWLPMTLDTMDFHWNLFDWNSPIFKSQAQSMQRGQAQLASSHKWTSYRKNVGKSLTKKPVLWKEWLPGCGRA